MDIQRKLLIKHLIGVLRKLTSDDTSSEIDPAILKFFTRKELIELINYKFKGTIPKEHDLAVLENEELLTIIGSELYFVALATRNWIDELEKPKEKTAVKPKQEAKITTKKSSSTPVQKKTKNETVSK